MSAFEPRSYAATSVPTRAELHYLNRLGTGYSRASFSRLRADGGADAWFARQLDPGSIAEATKVAAVDAWFPQRLHSMERKWDRHQSGARLSWQYAVEFGNWTMLRRMYSRRELFENMVDFWSNHFHVPAYAEKAWVARQGYDDVIRTHALGRFDDLLAAVSLHPAMLIYLDNFRSVRNAPNENQGRELLELHTVGRASGYTETMVKHSAVILSGWTIRYGTTWTRYYSAEKHTMGPVRVLGFSHPNDTADGRAACAAYLKYLAHHPATARTIARKLALRFVGDQPSDDLVERVAQAFLASGTDIKATLRALVATEEFRASFGAKVRTPVDDLIATTRALRVVAHEPTSGRSFAQAIAYNHGGDRLFSWPRPDGAPLTNDVWCSVSRMLGSYRMHWQMGGRSYPTRDVTYRKPASWLPKDRMRLDVFVDHLSRMVLGRPSTALLLQAVCEATELTPGTIVTKDHSLFGWRFPRLMSALLDSPAHMTR